MKGKYKSCKCRECNYHFLGLCHKPKEQKQLGEFAKRFGCICRRTD